MSLCAVLPIIYLSLANTCIGLYTFIVTSHNITRMWRANGQTSIVANNRQTVSVQVYITNSDCYPQKKKERKNFASQQTSQVQMHKHLNGLTARSSRLHFTIIACLLYNYNPLQTLTCYWRSIFNDSIRIWWIFFPFALSDTRSW